MENNLFDQFETSLDILGLNIVSSDKNRPWGGFFVVDEGQASTFIDFFFEELDVSDLKISGKLSPKLLFVAPEKRLSWQYHFRRAEIWKVLTGPVGVIKSKDDKESDVCICKPGEIIKLQQGERHRLVGLADWGVLAEIWQHTDASCPSDEDDIVRIQDDFGR